MEAAAFERTARMGQVEPLAVVGVVAVWLSIVHGRVEGEDRLLAPIRLEPAPDLVEARLERVCTAGDDAVQDDDGLGIPVQVDEHPSLVGPGGPRGHAARLATARRRGQQTDGGIEVRDDLVSRSGDAGCSAGIVRFPEVDCVGLDVIRDVAPHPPCFEVEVGAQEDGFALDRGRVRVRNLPRLGGAHLGQEPDGGVGSANAFVHARPFAVQIVLRFIAGPGVQLDVGGLRLIGRLGALVGFVGRDAPERPVARRAPPVSVGGVVAVERAIRRDQRPLHTRFRLERILIERALRRRVEKVLTRVDSRAEYDENRRTQHQPRS